MNSDLTLMDILLIASSSTSENTRKPELELREFEGSSGSHWSWTRPFSSRERGRSRKPSSTSFIGKVLSLNTLTLQVSNGGTSLVVGSEAR